MMRPRSPRTVRQVVAAVTATTFAVTPAAMANDCKGNLQACGAATVTETPRDFRGAIIVPGSDAANAAVAQSGGCEGCEWTLVLNCDHQDVEHGCGAARCPEGALFRLFLQRPTDDKAFVVDRVCLTPTRRIVTATELAVDVERHLTNLTPPTTAIAVQPDGRAVTNLATYFRAAGATTVETTLDVTTAAGPATLRIHIVASGYAWRFGDGTTCETTEPGLPYDGGEPGERCGDQVAHVYDRALDATVALAATWRGTYSFDVGFGPVGPLPVPGDGVTAAPTTRTVSVRDARAQLVGG